MNIGFAICGSFCTFASVFSAMENLAFTNQLTPILSHSTYTIDSRFGTAKEHAKRVTDICKSPPLTTIAQVEPIGPKKLLDVLVIAPCTGNTLAKLAHGIADGPVTMAAKSHFAVSTNDALSGAAENIGRLLNRKNIYFVPFGQDDPDKKPYSMVADFSRIPQTVALAAKGKQIQPIVIKAHNL